MSSHLISTHRGLARREFYVNFRWSSGRKLRWEEKQSYHAQLEILMNTVTAIMGQMFPLMYMGASALSATSSALLIHMHSLKSSESCRPCMYVDLAWFAFLSSLGAFMLFQYMENLAEESAGVLREIEEEIIVKASRGTCFYGGRAVRRSLPARLFRRRIMRVRMGEFSTIEAGFAVDFLLQTADNIVTYVFMVNVGTEVWLA